MTGTGRCISEVLDFTDTHTDSYPNFVGNADSECYPDSFSNGDSYANSSSDPFSNGDSEAERYADGYSYSYFVGGPDCYTNRVTYSNTDYADQDGRHCPGWRYLYSPVR